MRVLFATAEAAPFFKTGGLGDVARALPDELASRGHDVRVIMPAYDVIARQRLDLDVESTGSVPWPDALVPVRYLTPRDHDRAPTVFVHQPAFFEGGAPYTASLHDPLATGRRFAFFCRAVVRYARAWGADVVHLNDWPTGLVPAWGLLDGLEAGTVFTIHNLAYQGNYPPTLLNQAGLPADLYRTENGVEFHGQVSFMKGGLALADQITTVSPTYAEEIRTPEFGTGLDGLLRFRRRALHGVLNGIDPAAWQPAMDRQIPAGYSAVNLGPKERNRTALLEETGLEDGGPVFGMVTRLAYQKGIDLLLSALPSLLDAGVRLVVLGDGDAQYEHALARAAAHEPGRIATFARFDDALARRIYAGSDFFLMPSLYEPCGLGQMIAQRYGTPPVVRRTGGLADTVEDGRTGFLFEAPRVGDLMDAVGRARRIWRARGWVSLQRRCMRLDWSWARAADRYERIYTCATGRFTG